MTLEEYYIKEFEDMCKYHDELLESEELDEDCCGCMNTCMTDEEFVDFLENYLNGE